MIELYPHQIDAYGRLRDIFAQRSNQVRAMTQAPTGWGKTIWAARIIQSALNQGKRVVFTVPRLYLVEQTSEVFWNHGIREVGIIQGNHRDTNWSRPVQIASIQTLCRRGAPDADLALVDEAHEWYQFYETWMRDKPSTQFVGLSATPWSKGLGNHYSNLIIAGTIAQQIETGYASPFVVYAPSTPDLTGISKTYTRYGRDYNQEELGRRLNDVKLVADIVSTWLRLGEGRATLCFAVNRAHAKHIQEKFQAAGIAAGYVDCNTPADERKQIKEQFHDGVLKVVCNVGVLTMGVDWDVRCIILACSTESEMKYVQIIGRGLRLAEGKDHLLVLDHSDTVRRLGFVTDIHYAHLSSAHRVEPAERKPPELKACPECDRLKKPGKCPHCGHMPARPANRVKTADGDLALLDMSKAEKWSMAEKMTWYAALLGYARDRGYQDGWAYHKYKIKFKVAPSWRINQVSPTPAKMIGAQILSWIRSQQIAWAKNRKNPHNRLNL